MLGSILSFFPLPHLSMPPSSSRVIAALAACGVAVSLAACTPSNKPASQPQQQADAKLPVACAKITDAKDKQHCVATWKVATDQCEKEKAAFDKKNADPKQKFNVAACTQKKFDAAMKAKK